MENCSYKDELTAEKDGNFQLVMNIGRKDIF